MSDIEWSDLPPRRRPGRQRDQATLEFVAALRERPGEWARYHRQYAHASCVDYRRRAHPDIEWTARKREDGRYDMYARYPST